MPRLLILYHSRTGGARQMAQAAHEAALEELEDSMLQRAEDTTPDDILNADGYLFCAPENLATLSGAMKEMFDRCYYPVLGRIEGRPYGLMICAGSDGEGAMRQTARIAQGWRLKQVQEPFIICTHAQTPDAILAGKHLTEAELAPCRELGAALAAGLALGVF